MIEKVWQGGKLTRKDMHRSTPLRRKRTIVQHSISPLQRLSQSIDLPGKDQEKRRSTFALRINNCASPFDGRQSSTDEFKNRYRWRAGVEATMSEFDRRTGVKRLRVRGFKAVRFSATLKALGLNILRAAAVMAAMPTGTPEQTDPEGGYNASINVFKERFWAVFAFFARLLSCTPFLRVYTQKLILIENDFLRVHQICFFINYLLRN